MEPAKARQLVSLMLNGEEASQERFSAAILSAATVLPDLSPVAYGRSDDLPAAIGIAGDRIYGLRLTGGEEHGAEAWSWRVEDVSVLVSDAYSRVSRRHAFTNVADAVVRRTWRFSSGDRDVTVGVEFEVEDRAFARLEVACHELAAATGAKFVPPRPEDT